MTRTISAALALACAVPFALLGGCNLTASQAQIQAALNPGTITAGQLTASNLTALGATTPDLQKAAAVLAQVRIYAADACSVEPSLATVANIAAALAGASAAIVPAEQIATIACAPFGNPAKLTSGTAPEKAAPKATARPARKPGDQVRGAVIVNGVPITVEGTVVATPKAR